MPVPSVITDLSQTAASNYPQGSDSPSTLDDVQRAHGSFIAQLRDGKGFTNPVVLASAATTDIGGQNSQFVEISGTTTITSFGTTYNGPRYLRFQGALTLTYNATTLILPGAASITTAAGDTCIVVPNQALNGWTVVSYTANTGVVYVSGNQTIAGTKTFSSPPVWSNGSAATTLATAVATTSGTSIDFTSIPSWVKRITVMLNGVSTSGASIPMIRLGTGGTPTTSGYLSCSSVAINATTNSVISNTDGFGFYGGAATYVMQGSIIISNITGNTWVCQGNICSTSGVTFVSFVAGSVSLSGTLNMVRLTTSGGTDTFDAGSINIIYE